MYELDKTSTWGRSEVHKIVLRTEDAEVVENWIKSNGLNQIDQSRWSDDEGNYYKLREV
jgi:hypothetical protein